MDEYEDYEEGFEDELDEDDMESRLMELELQGAMDGELDADDEDRQMASYGLSVDDLDELSDEEREAYEQGYYEGVE